MSGSTPFLRLAAVALLAGSAAACSADANRMSDPNSNPFAASDRMAPAYTGSVGSAPTAAVQSAPMNAPGGYQPAPSYGAPAQISPQGGNPGSSPYGGSPYGAAPAAPASYASNPPPAAQPIYGARPQTLSAPHASAAPARTPVASAGGGTHVVASGESLTSIARLYGVPRTTLAETNKMDVNGSVRIGQRIAIPGSGSLAASAAKPAATTAAPAVHAAAKPATTAPVVAAAPAKPKPTASQWRRQPLLPTRTPRSLPR